MSFNLNIRSFLRLFWHKVSLKVILTMEHYIKLLTIFIWKFAIFWSWKLALSSTWPVLPSSKFFSQYSHCDNLPLVTTSPGLPYVKKKISSENSQYFGAENLPCEIWDNLPQRDFFTYNRLTATMSEIFILLTSPCIR